MRAFAKHQDAFTVYIACTLFVATGNRSSLNEPAKVVFHYEFNLHGAIDIGNTCHVIDYCTKGEITSGISERLYGSAYSFSATIGDVTVSVGV